MKILIVDDSDLFLNALEAILQSVGYKNVIKANSYERANKILKTCDIDIILMDVMMPNVDGIKAISLIKSDNNLRDIPIIMVSALNDEARIEKAFLAGAIDYISKPVKKLELRARVRSVLKLKKEIDYRKEKERELERLNHSLEKANKELLRLSTVDGLTGIYNRRYFDLIIEKEWKRGAREKQKISIILADIDYFKLYNDNYGHLEGDKCLRIIACKLQEVIKRPADLLARYGGEEFVILLPNTDQKGAYKIAKDIQKRVRSSCINHNFSNVGNVVTLSIGVATAVPDIDLKYHNLIEHADKAMYIAKSNGRNQIVISDNLVIK